MNHIDTEYNQPTEADMVRAARIVWHLITFEPPCVTGDGYRFNDDEPAMSAHPGPTGDTTVSFKLNPDTGPIVFVSGSQGFSVNVTMRDGANPVYWVVAATADHQNLAAAVRHYAMHVRRVMPEWYAAVVDHVDGGR